MAASYFSILEGRALNRQEFQALANLRIKEAKVLLDNRCFEGAYYLSGYAIECALKACIAKKTRRGDFPPDRRTIETYYTHNLGGLLASAELKLDLDREMTSNPNLETNWLIVRGWSEGVRYKVGISEPEASDVFNAIVDRRHGVLTWLKRRW